MKTALKVSGLEYNRRLEMRNSLGRIALDERGNVAMMFGLLLGVMCLCAGAAIDIGSWMQARTQTEQAIDAAVLAGLRKYQETQDASLAIQTAQINYDYNVAQRSDVLTDTISFELIGNNTEMTATGDVTISTPFLSLASIPSLPLLRTDGSELAVSKMAIGPNTGTSLEISIMIDNTGSMNESDFVGSTKIADVTAAAARLVDQVIWTDQSAYTSKIAIIPFSESVNLGSAATANLARGTLPAGSSTTPGSQSYTTGSSTYTADPVCVTERLGAQAYTDAAPTSYPVGILYDNGSCPTTATMVPLTNNKTLLHTTISSLSAGGSTAGHLGTAWAWYALSPNFNALWPSASSAARPYSDLRTLNSSGQPVLRKVAILMTDGDYNTEYCDGVSDQSSGCTANNGASNSQAGSLCIGMKNAGIEVYTIGAQVSATAKSFLVSCATDANHYYDAANGTQLLAAFDDITKKLVQPYLTH